MKSVAARYRFGRLRSSSSRYVMAAIAALSLISVLSVYAHLLLVEHTTCPEDGELIDRPAGTAQLTAPDRARPPAHASWRDNGAGERHSHHHCEFVPKRREVFTCPRCPAPLLVAPEIPSATSSSYATPPRPAIALLRLAPKQSPTT